MAEEKIQDLGVELTPSTGLHDLDGLVHRKRRPIDAVAEKSVEDVGDRGDPTLQRDLVADESVRIPAAVVALVEPDRVPRRLF